MNPTGILFVDLSSLLEIRDRSPHLTIDQQKTEVFGGTNFIHVTMRLEKAANLANSVQILRAFSSN